MKVLGSIITLYYYKFKVFNIDACLYKICDDSIRLKHFLGTNNKDGIKAILSKHEGHFLYEFIDGDELLHLVIDFDLPIEILNVITSKLSYSQIKNLLYYAFKDIYLKVFSK